MRWKLQSVGFISKSRSKPDKIEVPADYQEILLKARPLLRKKFHQETNIEKKNLLQGIIDSNDKLINALT